MEIKTNQYTTQRGFILAAGMIISLIFEWFGHDSSRIMPLITIFLAGLHGIVTDDTKEPKS
jgi:hypothetical protein